LPRIFPSKKKASGRRARQGNVLIKRHVIFFQRSIVQEATELKEKATNVEEALSDVNGFLQRLQDLAEEVR